MFAQVIRFKLKPDAWDKLRELDERYEREEGARAPGFRGGYLLREQGSSDHGLMVVFFENQQLARQNSERPETDRWSRELRQLTEGEPEFIDTDVLWATRMQRV